jgi:L-fuculose-phosphate aldolase
MRGSSGIKRTAEEVSLEEAINFGKKLYERGLVDGASGNLSFRMGNRFLITRTGVNLELLDDDSFVELEVKPYAVEEVKAFEASSDTLVHAKIYLKTNFKAIMHCHGTYNVVLSLLQNRIKPLDLEGRLFLGEIEVLSGEFMSEEIAEKISNSVSEKGYAVVRGHGVYAAGNSFIEAFNLLSYVEHSCRIVFLKEIFERR